jgi:hypothetical protein
MPCAPTPSGHSPVDDRIIDNLPYDLKTPRWKAAMVDAVVERREELEAALDEGALFTEDELMTLLQLEYGDWRHSREHGVIPRPDCGEFYSRAVAEELAGRAGQLREQIPPQPLGARRCAELLAELTGLKVTEDDLRLLIEQGHVAVVDWYKDWPLYDTAEVRRLGTTADGIALVTATVTDRQAWLEAPPSRPRPPPGGWAGTPGTWRASPPSRASRRGGSAGGPASRSPAWTAMRS